MLRLSGQSVVSLAGRFSTIAIGIRIFLAALVALVMFGTGSAVSEAQASTYHDAVLADSPVAFWPLDETSGNPVDATGNGHNLSWESGPPAYGVDGPTTDGETAVGLASEYDAESPEVYGSMSSASDLAISSGTLEAWVKTTVTDSDSTGHNWEFVAGKQNAYGIFINGGEPLVYDWGSRTWTQFPVDIADGQWHYLALTFGDGTATLYVDGSSVGSQEWSVGSQSSPFTVGYGLWYWQYLVGDIADVAVYNKELTALGIASHYLRSGNTPPPTHGPLTPGEAPTGCKCAIGIKTRYPVNTESGNFFHTFTDVSIPGPSHDFPLSLTRTYNSQNASVNGPFGYGWGFNYGMSLAVTGTSPNQVATVTEEDGPRIPFDQPASGSTWAPASTFDDTLTYNSGSSTWTFVRSGRDTFTFNSLGQLAQEQDLNGLTTTLSYTGGNLTTVTDSVGRTLTLGWTGSHITSLTDSNVSGNTRSVSYGYTSGNLTSVTDVNGGITDLAYDASSRMTLMRAPNFHSNGALGTAPASCSSTPIADAVNNHYDSTGRVDCQWDPKGQKTTFAYSGSPQTAGGGTTIVTDPAGNQTEDSYQWGVRTSDTTGYGTSDAATTYFTYDPATLALTRAMDPNGNITSYTVDSHGNMLTRTDPLGRVTTNTYNSLNELLTTEDGNGVTTTNTYDSHGNLLTTSTPLTGTSATATNCKSPSTAVAIAQVTCFTYGNSTFPGTPTQITDPDGNVTYQHLDSNGYVDEVKDPAGHVSATVRNNDGWITATYTPKAGCTWNSNAPAGCSSTYETQYDYGIVGGSGTDEFGDVGTITDPLGHTTKYTYDADRNILTTQDGNGNTTTKAYNPDSELCWTLPGGTSSNGCGSPPTGARVTDYNADGTVADYKDGKGNAIETFGYNHRGQLTSTEDALGNTKTYTLDSNGNILAKLDPVSGATCTGTKVGCTTYTYDVDSEPKTVSYSDTSSENITNIAYDSDGQRTGMTDGTGTSSWSYDSLHRLTSYVNGNGKTVTYGYTYGAGPTYDLNDQVRTIAYPNSVGTVAQTWNADGSLGSVQDWNGNTTTFGYDSNGNQTGQTVPSTTNVTDTFGYNAADQMTSVSDSNGTTLFSATYTRDANGQASSDSSQSSSQQNYQYTALNQLCYAGSSNTSACSSPPSGSAAYGYDNADNLTTNNGTAQQYNNADQLCWTYTGTSSNACASAPSGATTFGYDNKGNRTSMVATGNAGTCYSYDQANLLTKVQTGTGSSCTTPTTVGSYAYDGEGIRESKTVSGTTTQFAWDGLGQNLLQQNDGTTKTSFIYGPGGIPVEQIAGSTVTYLHHDQIGSIRLLTDNAGSTSTATTKTWDSYGNNTSSSGTLTSPFGYTGQYTDPETSLQSLRARYYDPQTGQFVSSDPLEAVTQQPYSYANGNPINETDPTGLWGWNPISDIAEAGSDAAAAGGAAWSWTTTAASNTVNWASSHYGQIAEYAAAGVCVVASDGLCLVAIGTAIGADTVQNAAETFGAGGLSLCEAGSFAQKEGVTLLANVVLGGGGIIKAGLGATGAFGEGAESVLPSSLAGRAALNAPFSAGGATITALGGQISSALGADGSCGCGG